MHTGQVRRHGSLSVWLPIEIGSHTECFSDALRSSLREDPDVILVGEMRDLETIHLALTVAETGILVISGKHKLEATLAAIRGGFVTHLVLDEPTGKALLKVSI